METPLVAQTDDIAAWNVLFEEMKVATIRAAAAGGITSHEITTLTESIKDPQRRILIVTLILALLK